MIHEEICTYEVCQLAKEKGFDWGCLYHYDRKGSLREHYDYDADNSGIGVRELLRSKVGEEDCLAPTQSLLQRWLREEKRVVFGISPMQEMDCDYLAWCVTIYKVDENGYGLSWQEELYYDTYELALEDALKYALENLVI